MFIYNYTQQQKQLKFKMFDCRKFTVASWQDFWEMPETNT